MTHKVYLVGAGPGDPGLITLKGAELLRRADIVIYDFLANVRLLALARDDAELICVGKAAGQHSWTQEEINQLLVTSGKKGETVVRLKGGDPFVFGRGGEEALALAQAGIPYEVVPGVTAGLAGLAYAGIPATHRGAAVNVTLVTGHEDPTKETSDLDWKALAATGGTMVVYMGIRNLEAIVNGLVDGGLSADTPAAVIRMATFPEQRVITSTLSEIEKRVQDEGITPPALLCVGQVVDLRDQLAWYDKLPLSGKKIVITRPREQSTQQREALEALGAEVIENPTIMILPPENHDELDQAVNSLDDFDFLIFTSVNGVRFFFERLIALDFDARKLAECAVCVIGPGTERAVQTFGVQPDLMPETYTSRSLVPALVDRFNPVSGKKALLPRADIAPDLLLKDLEKAGIQVKAITAYRTVAADDDDGKVRALFKAGQVDAVTFASSSAATNFIDRLGSDFLKANKGKTVFASIGPVTSKTLTDAGFPPDVEAEKQTIPGLAQALINHFNGA